MSAPNWEVWSKERQHEYMSNESNMAKSELATGSTFYPLFEHMSHEHGLTLSESEMAEITHVADKMRMQQSGMVQWILINALHHLDGDQLKELLHEISKRICPPNV